nr:hypothetical protein [uncultured Oscillibacter sp.]
MNIEFFLQRVFFYMQNPNQILPTVKDAEQAMEVEKMRKGVSDLFEARRRIDKENQGIALEVLCLELAHQVTKDRQENGGLQ